MHSNSKYPTSAKQAYLIKAKSEACQSARFSMDGCVDDAIVYEAAQLKFKLRARGAKVHDDGAEELVMKLFLFMADKWPK